MATSFEQGQRVSLPKTVPGWVTIDLARKLPDDGWSLYVIDDHQALYKAELTAEEAARVQVLARDGGAPSARILAGMWTQWMGAAATNASSTSSRRHP